MLVLNPNQHLLTTIVIIVEMQETKYKKRFFWEKELKKKSRSWWRRGYVSGQCPDKHWSINQLKGHKNSWLGSRYWELLFFSSARLARGWKKTVLYLFPPPVNFKPTTVCPLHKAAREIKEHLNCCGLNAYNNLQRFQMCFTVVGCEGRGFPKTLELFWSKSLLLMLLFEIW